MSKFKKRSSGSDTATYLDELFQAHSAVILGKVSWLSVAGAAAVI